MRESMLLLSLSFELDFFKDFQSRTDGRTNGGAWWWRRRGGGGHLCTVMVVVAAVAAIILRATCTNTEGFDL